MNQRILTIFRPCEDWVGFFFELHFGCTGEVTGPKYVPQDRPIMHLEITPIQPQAQPEVGQLNQFQNYWQKNQYTFDWHESDVYNQMCLPLSTAVYPVTSLLTVKDCWRKCRIFIVYSCTKEQNALFDFTNLNGRKRSRKEVSKIPNTSIRDLACRAVFTWLSKGIGFGFGFGFTTPFGWLLYLLWFWFYDSQVKTALTALFYWPILPTENREMCINWILPSFVTLGRNNTLNTVGPCQFLSSHNPWKVDHTTGVRPLFAVVSSMLVCEQLRAKFCGGRINWFVLIRTSPVHV